MKRMLATILVILSGIGLTACLTSISYTARVEAAYPPQGRLLEVMGKLVHVIERGDPAASPVLLIHGASANAREFTWSLAPRLEGDHYVLMADRPGHGWSERAADASTLGAQARQMAGVLDKLAPGRQAVIVGHSFGGAVALRLALDRPELVSGLVLLAPATHPWETGGTAWYNELGAHGLIGPVFSQLAPLIGPPQLGKGVTGVFSPVPAPEDYTSLSAIGLVLRPASFRANARDLTTLKKELSLQAERYQDLEMPVVVFSGSLDTVLSPAIHAGQLKRQVDIDLVILKEEGHMPHHGKGAEVADAIRRLAIAPQRR